MTLTLTPELEALLAEHAMRRGTTPEALAVQILHDRLVGPAPLPPPRDDWERLLRSVASDCGTSSPPGGYSREEIYD